MSYVGALSLYGGLILAASLAGGAVPLLVPPRETRTRLLLGVSAGILLGAVFFHMLPSAFGEFGGEVGAAAAAGFLALYLLERYFLVHVCEAGDCEVHRLGATAIIGLTFHALTEGIALGAALESEGLGFPVFLAVLAHKAPASFSLVAILLAEGMARGRVVLWAIAFAAAVPVGALLYKGVLLVGGLGPSVQGSALGFSAGTFLHIALSDLLPELHRRGVGRPGVAHVVAGVALMYGLSWVS